MTHRGLCDENRKPGETAEKSALAFPESSKGTAGEFWEFGDE
jgi:hypothetical protein